jgi:hypothetical protein
METEKNPSPVACHVRNKLSLNGDRLRAHFLDVHSGIRYNCDLCKYSGATQGNVRVHTLGVHLRSRKWKCELCDYAAATKGTLRQHVQNIHSK